MSKEILNLAPEAIWRHFYSLTQIPRPSKKEAQAIAFLKKFGEDLGLETIVDAAGNVIIRKPATAGMEDRMGVIMQGHIDMVPQANSDSQHDFEKDPIDAFVDGDWVTANGTTLGADNGMGVAAAMAVLESNDLVHGPLEALFTIDEETGMTGAFELKPGFLKGDILLNMDSEDEGELYVGCAGGIDGNISMEFDMEAAAAGTIACNIALTGLKGGHSGMDIPLGRGNSNKLLFRFLKHTQKNYGMRIASLQGGSLRNAIPRESFATVVIPENHKAAFMADLKQFEETFKKELSAVEPTLAFAAEATEMPAKVMEAAAQARLINAIYGCPNGVIRMSNDMEGLVETSTNLALVNIQDGKAEVQCLIRSSVESAKDDLAEMMASVFELAGCKIVFDGAYPGWKPNMDSPILKAMQSTYKGLYGKIPEIKAIHAGLECGLLGAVYPNWDMISFGPTIRSPHSPDEKVHIQSVEKFWEFLAVTLKNIPQKN